MLGAVGAGKRALEVVRGPEAASPQAHPVRDHVEAVIAAQMDELGLTADNSLIEIITIVPSHVKKTMKFHSQFLYLLSFHPTTLQIQFL